MIPLPQFLTLEHQINDWTTSYSSTYKYPLRLCISPSRIRVFLRVRGGGGWRGEKECYQSYLYNLMSGVYSAHRRAIQHVRTIWTSHWASTVILQRFYPAWTTIIHLRAYKTLRTSSNVYKLLWSNPSLPLSLLRRFFNICLPYTY